MSEFTHAITWSAIFLLPLRSNNNIQLKKEELESMSIHHSSMKVLVHIYLCGLFLKDAEN